MSISEDLRSKWARFLPGNCGGCVKRRAAIKKIARSFLRKDKKTAVMFSGGLDSAYVAWKLKQDGEPVELYHVRWLFDAAEDNARELSAAQLIAYKLGLKLNILGTIRVSKEHAGNVMRIPTIFSMLVCHRTLRFDRLATGMAPSISGRDHHWHWLESMSKYCMPGLEIVHPRDGILRSRISELMPQYLVDLVYSARDKDDGE
jgi:hypothetical protein